MKKAISVTFNFTVDINDTTGGGRPCRLLAAVLVDERVLQQAVKRAMIDWLEQCEDWHPLLDGIEWEDVLSPATASLSAEDRHYYTEAHEEGLLYEALEDVRGCFGATVGSVEVREG